MQVYTITESPIDDLFIATDGEAIIAISMSPFLDAISASTTRNDHHPLLVLARTQLGEYFSGARTHFELPLSPSGTAFQIRVWNALAEIPYGATETYGEVARQIGNPAASRAVGLANGANPIAIVIPCHRVIGAGGKLTGYGGGLPRKRILLDLETSATRLLDCSR